MLNYDTVSYIEINTTIIAYINASFVYVPGYFELDNLTSIENICGTN